MGADMVEAVTIDGLAVRIDKAKLADWHTFSIIRKMQGAGQFAQLEAMFEIIEYATDQSEASIIAHLGGDTAKAEDVMNLAAKIVQAATPKN